MFKKGKRKRSDEAAPMSSTDGSKKPSSRRRNLEPEDDIICIDLESDAGNAKTINDGASSSKKKRLNIPAAVSTKGPVTPTKPREAYKPPRRTQETTGNGGGGILADVNIDSRFKSNSKIFQPERVEPKIFKVPEVPHRVNVVPVPSTSRTSFSTSIAAASKRQAAADRSRKPSKKETAPNEKQLETTGTSKNLRKAFVDAIQSSLEDETPESLESLRGLLNNIDCCVPSRLFIFATRRLPEGEKFEDLSNDSEVEEFARWWLFGVTALLFSCPKPVAQKVFLRTRKILTTLCKLLLCGHPSIVDRISVQLFGVLKDLLVRNQSGIEGDNGPVLKINLFRAATGDDDGRKQSFSYNINITEMNEWIIPYYIQSISPLLTRICLHNVKIFHFFNNLLQRLLTRLTTPDTVATVLASFPSFVLVDAHTFFLTEDSFSNIFGTVLQAPTVDIGKVRHFFSQHDQLQSHHFAEFLHNSGLGLLHVGIKDCMRSGKFAHLNSSSDFNGAIVEAYKFIIDGSRRSSKWVAAEIVPLMRFMSKLGLQTLLHPLIEQLILAEMLSRDINLNREVSVGVECNPRLLSTIWNRMFQFWEDSLSYEFRSLSSRSNPVQISEENQRKTSSFFSDTAAVTKLTANLMSHLRKKDLNVRFEFFELKHLQRWYDVSNQSLINGIKFTDQLYHMYSAILDTIVHLDSCNWFGTTLAGKFLNNLISISGWLWLSKFDESFPDSFKPFPTFTRAFNSSDLQFIRGSSLLLSKAIRVLRLDIFRTWESFVSEVYISLMETQTTLDKPFLVMEILRAIADVSWIFKKAVSLSTTFTFLKNIVQSDLWKAYPGVRSCLGEAITSLPCICHCNVHQVHLFPSSSGCEKRGCTSFKTKLIDEDKQDLGDLEDLYIKSIVTLALPLLRSKFLLVKMTLSGLISNCHNHVKTPSSSIIIPMIEIALDGHLILCEEILHKVGSIVDADVSQRIFSSVIPRLCARKQAKNRKHRLSLRTREKILKGIVKFSTVGPLSMSIFVEILKCIIPIVAQTRGNENSVTILSQKIVSRFAEVHACQPHELLARVRYEISKSVVKSALNEFYQPDLPESDVQQRIYLCVKFIVRLKYIGKFRLAFVRYFYPPLMEIILPKIIDVRYQFLLSCLAQHVNDVESIMLQEYIMHYFPTLLLDHSSETITKCLQFLKDRYGFDPMFAAKQQEQRILNEALCRLGDREDKVLRFLSLLCKWDDQSSKLVYTHGTANRVSRSEYQELLSKRLLGFFIHLDTKLQSRIETAEAKQSILKSFTALIKLMGKSKITPVRSKVYKTLYSATKEGPQYHEVLYDAWKEFAHNLDNTSFTSMTPQILASILPLRESPSIRSKVDRLISHFVCYKKDLTVEHHQALYFLLDQCEDPEVTQAIGQAVDRMKQTNWSDYFNMVVREATNENPPIRYEAFRKLRSVFRFDWELVEKFVLVKGQQYVSRLISTLLAGLRGTGNSEDEKVRSIIVDCFGCVGALDPVRFRNEDDYRCSRNSLSTSLAISGKMSMFIVLYLGELIREFQEVKDTTNFDYCAYLIQIVLKEFKVNPKDPNDQIWRNLNKEQQDTISPMFTTKYQMDHGTSVSNVECPIYLSEHGKSFDSWLINWMCVLISYITEKEPQAFSLFRKSKSVLKTNVRIATFIIPFVAIYAIFCATREQRGNIVAEIKTVLERWVELAEMKQKENSVVPVKDSEVETGVKEEPLSVENESIFHARCTQVIFSILDHLLRSSSFAKRKLGLKKATEAALAHRRVQTSVKSATPPMSESDLTAVEAVLKEIPPRLISEVAWNCSSFPAALYYLEQELKNNPSEETLQANIDYLQRLYICLGEMDSVEGIAAVRNTTPSFAGQILQLLVNGRTQESVKRLELMTTSETDDFQLHQALVRAYLKVEEPNQAETFIEATLCRQPEWELDLQEVHMEALLELQKWPELNKKVDTLEEMKDNKFLEEKFLSWNVAIPSIVSKLQRNQTNAASELISELKNGVVAPLVATCEEMYPYKRAYPHIVQLHILTEIEDAIKLLHKYSNAVAAGRTGSTQGWVQKEVARLMNKWEVRLWNVSKSRKMVDQILYVRKNILQVMKTTFESNPPICDVLNASIRDCWLDIARDASKCGDFARADNCIRQAKHFMSPKVMIEEAKILNRKGEKGNAISALQAGITKCFPQLKDWKTTKSSSIIQPPVLGVPDPPSNREPQLLCSKAHLLLAKLSEDQKLLDMEQYIAMYKDASDLYKESEKNYFTLGSYHDRLLSAADKSQPNFESQQTVVRYYSLSLCYGCKYVYQSLPRLLSIWFDFARGVQTGDFTRFSNGIPPTAPSSVDTSGSSANSSSSRPYSPNNPNNCLENIKTSILNMSRTVPAYVMMTAFTQLVSRLCHCHAPTWTVLKDIIVRIIATHPQQTLWMTMAVYKSVNPMRRRRCMEIYRNVEQKTPALKETIKDYTNLTERLIDLCEKPTTRDQSAISLEKLYDKLPKLIRHMGPGKVAVPFQVFMNPSLPRKGVSHKEHNPYPESLVFIEDIEDTVEVMNSLIRPKKITLRATNGKSYSLLCKPKDDLRKDSKVMELNNVVNWYLSQNSESSQRRLHVRTYLVVPLNEECGLLEWVPNLTTFRNVVNSIYKEKNITPFRGPNRIYLNMPLEVKKTNYLKYLLGPSPPVFGDWFFNQFNDHQSWYTARMSYIRTAAVMSIVGYIMGLGDRHGENILLDSVTGEVVHVDFNCLFNKGETFEWAERVPFRLTQNMVDGMGPLKYEGVFRKTCEIVMGMFREHKSIFLSVLRPFVFDPLVEWQKKEKGQLATLEAGELTNEKAVDTMKYIRHRLSGTARNMMRDINTELSVKAHVHYLIEEATSIDNLCQMWIGWAAYM